MNMDDAIKAIKWAKKERAEVFIVNTQHQLELLEKAAQLLKAGITIRLPRGGPCLVCYENHEDWDRDCHPPTDYSSIMPKIVSLSPSLS